MRFTVTFTGDTFPVTIEQTQATNLMRMLASTPKPEYIQIEQRLVKSTTIRSVEPQAIEHTFDSKEEESRKERLKADAKQAEGRYRRMQLPFSERAREPDILRLAWLWITGNNGIPPDEALPEIFLASEMYLRDNPDASYANPKCYKYILERYAPQKDLRNVWVINSLGSLIERILSHDA